MEYSVSKLAVLASNREIPGFFEEAYERRTGVNPVAVAIGIQRATEGKFRVRVLLIIATLLAVAFCSAVLDHSSFAVVFTIVIGALIGSFVLSLSLSFAEVCQYAPTKPEASQHVNEFCRCLFVFEGQTNHPITEFKSLDGRERAKKIVYGVMVQAASAMREHKMTELGLGDLYDTFLTLGLVPPGGYRRYHKVAGSEAAIAA